MQDTDGHLRCQHVENCGFLRVLKISHAFQAATVENKAQAALELCRPMLIGETVFLQTLHKSGPSARQNAKNYLLPIRDHRKQTEDTTGTSKKMTTNCDYETEHSPKKRPIAQQFLESGRRCCKLSCWQMGYLKKDPCSPYRSNCH